MKHSSFLAVAATAVLTVTATPVLAEQRAPSLVYETPREFFGSGDFDKDGRTDLVIVDKESGKYRLGYQLTPGVFSWVDCRMSGIKGVAGFSIGQLLATNQEALAFTSPDANAITLLDVSSATAPGKPVTVPFTDALGPNTVVALEIGGEGNTSLADLYVGSIYNSPDPSQSILLRNDAAEFSKLAELTLAGPAVRGNRLSLKAGQPEAVCACWCRGTKGTRCAQKILAAASRWPSPRRTVCPPARITRSGISAARHCASFIVYKPGDKNLTVRPVEEPAAGQFQFGAGQSFDLGQPVRRVIVLDQNGAQEAVRYLRRGRKSRRLRFRRSEGARAGSEPDGDERVVYRAPRACRGAWWSFSQSAGGKFSTRYQIYKAEGGGLCSRPVRRAGLAGGQRQHHHPGHPRAHCGQPQP